MWSFRSATGGSGCTTVAVAASVALARRRATLLVDLRGDGPTVLGRERPTLGLGEWLDAARPPPDALARLELPVGDNLSILPLVAQPGPAPEPERVALLCGLLMADDRQVIVDVGTARDWADELVAASERALVVTRACYLSLARAVADERRCDGVVLVRERGRLIRPAEIRRAHGAPLVASTRWDPSVAAAVDIGTLGLRVPRSLRPLTRAFESW